MQWDSKKLLNCPPPTSKKVKLITRPLFHCRRGSLIRGVLWCFNNISVILWQSVLLVEETGGPGENHRPVQVTDKLYHIMLYTSPWSRFELTTSVMIGTYCIDSCKSNYHAITAMMALFIWGELHLWFIVILIPVVGRKRQSISVEEITKSKR
jgi:hypothetical protein